MGRQILNQVESPNLNFTIKRIEVRINIFHILHTKTAQYLSITLDVRLSWKAHLLSRHHGTSMSYINLNNKTLIIETRVERYIICLMLGFKLC